MKTLQMLKLKDIKRNQVFFEEDMGMVVKLCAIEDAREVDGETRKGYECRTQVVGGTAGTADENGIVTLFECHKPGAYGLRLHSA
jgi:hypothetical protein